ncbi:carboxypeptidase-like regulatory domain-containing protein [Nocardioides gilvus]|uniref:carboxypeptidase-like regulatory domain-containing protein n=1 Tax=Nocardioides gilvus TaxID=1735589 RepID=UPI000D743C48|nr:carboxypeptidase-like regulatory domain-containing protein [Nocardioides gilvus]
MGKLFGGAAAALALVASLFIVDTAAMASPLPPGYEEPVPDPTLAGMGGTVYNKFGGLMRDGVQAELQTKNTKGRWVAEKRPYSSARFIWTDAKWWFTELQPGTYRVKFTASQWHTYVTKPVTLKSGQYVVKNPRMNPGGRFTGKVTRAAGRDFAAGITVYKRTKITKGARKGQVKFKKAGSSIVDQDNKGFRVGKLRKGTYVICAALLYPETASRCVGGGTTSKLKKAKPLRIKPGQQKSYRIRLR